MNRTFTLRTAAGHPLCDRTGPVHVLYGVPLVAYQNESRSWALAEPTTGKLVQSFCRTQREVVALATERIERLGGVMALASNMAGIVPRLSPRVVHEAEFRYGAGGPLDAPQEIPTGETRHNHYGPAFQIGRDRDHLA